MSEIQLNPKQLQIIDDAQREIFIRWTEVESVCLYQLELPDSLLTYLIFDSESGDYIEVSSEDNGWVELLNALPQYLGCQKTTLQQALETITPETPPIELYTKSFL